MRETRRKTAVGSTDIKTPDTANTAKQLNAPARRTAAAWPAAKRKMSAFVSPPITVAGNKKSDAPFTTIVNTAEIRRMAHKLAVKILRREIGRGTRLK